MSRFPILVVFLCVALAQPHAVTYATQARAWDRTRPRYLLSTSTCGLVWVR